MSIRAYSYMPTKLSQSALGAFNLTHFRLFKWLLQEGMFFLIHLFARDIKLLKKLEIEKTKPTFIKSVLKVEY